MSKGMEANKKFGGLHNITINNATIPDLEKALKRVRAGSLTGLYISLIDSEAERADIEDYRPRNGNDPYSTILNALNEFLRSYLFLDWHPNA